MPSTVDSSRVRKWIIRVPASSANIGPGFDVLGLALSLHLTLNVTLTPCEASSSKVILNYQGEGAKEAPLDPYKNLITRVALYVLLSHDLTFPSAAQVFVDIVNQVPFGRGLGSSASAVVAGVLLASALGDLKLTSERIKDYSLMVERHPDNVTAALVGGFTGSFLRTLEPSELSPSSIPLAEVLPAYPANAGPPVPGEEPPQPPLNVGRHVRYGFSKNIGVVVVVPKFEVETAKARGALPSTYPRADVVYNLQRLAVLTASLAANDPDPNVIWEAMRDRVHQPYREGLIPGLSMIVNTMTPAAYPNLLGICLSGAGPTILALVSNASASDPATISTDATEITLGSSAADEIPTSLSTIGEAIKGLWAKEGIEVDWKALKVDEDGATLQEL